MDHHRFSPKNDGASCSGAAPMAPLWEQFELPGLLADCGADLFHSLGFFSPWLAECPSLVFVPDLVFHRYPESYSEREREYFAEWTLRAAESGVLFHCPSEATRRELRDCYGLPDADLADLYASARVLAFPSLWEGFGYPVLEAMACGVPVIAADLLALRELAGDAARFVDVDDREGWVSALEAAFADAVWHATAVERGLARSQQFTLARHAAELGELYAAAAATS